MMKGWRSLGGSLAVTCLLMAGLLPSQALAQAPRDFLLRQPRASLGLKAGYTRATVSSEIFDFTREQLTLGRDDFDAPSWGAQLAIQLSPRVDLAFDLSVASTRSKSEFRHWVDLDDLPIEQATEFRRIPFTVGFKAYLKDRGRSVGRFAWVPARFAPYVGAAGGWVWYTFEQEGDWVDYETYDIFVDRFTSQGKAPTVHVYGGADWSLGPAMFLTAEARYAYAKADMSGDFVDFDAMDLSGIQATFGISVRF